MRPQKLMDRILRVLQIGKLPRASGTGFATRRGEALGDAVIAERALVRRLRLGIEEAAAVGAGLDAVAAAEAVLLVDQHDAIWGDEGGAHRADLGAGRICAVIAHFGNEEVFAARFVDRRKSVLAAVGRIDRGI